MRKITFSIMAVALAAMTLIGCKKENSNNQEPEKQAEKTAMTFYAVPQGGERTELDGDLKSVWTEGDQIKIFTQETAAQGGDVFTLSKGAGTDYGEFTGESVESSEYVGAYPAGLVSFDRGVLFNLPGTQTYVENSYAPNTVPVLAISDSKNLTLENVTGLLRVGIKVVSPTTVTSMVLKDKNSDAELWGRFGMNGMGPIKPDSEGTGGDNTITMDLGSGVDLSSSDFTYFFFCLPANTLASGFTIEMVDKDGLDAVIDYTEADKKVEQGVGKTLEVEDVAFITSIRDACGNKYNAVDINGRMWLTENIHCNMIGESYEISQKMIGEDISRSSSFVVDEYGNWLYTWIAAVGCADEEEAKIRYGGLDARDFNNIQGVCPDGFHIPSMAESQTLLTQTATNKSVGLKSIDGGWDPAGTDYYGFSAYKVGEYSGTTMKQEGTLIWHTGSVAKANGRKVAYYVKLADEGYYTSKTYCNVDDFAFSVRCVNNIE